MVSNVHVKSIWTHSGGEGGSVSIKGHLNDKVVFLSVVKCVANEDIIINFLVKGSPYLKNQIDWIQKIDTMSSVLFALWNIPLKKAYPLYKKIAADFF